MNSRKSAAIYSEADLHRTVAEYLDYALIAPATYSTFPAGWGKLGRAMAGQLKASGLKPGMPDIFVFDRFDQVSTRTYPKIVGIELKVPGQKPSAAQQLMFDRLRSLGIPIYVCECVEDVVLVLRREQIAQRELHFMETADAEAGDDGTEARSEEEPTQSSLR